MKNFSTQKFNSSLNFVYILLLILILPLYPIIYGQNIPWTKYGNYPVLEPGPSGSWDDEAVGVGCVLFENNTYKMWYNGYDGTFVRIGYATSPDGIVWSKYELNPVLDLGVSGQWDDYWVLIGDVIHVDTIYHMWYTGDDGLVNESGGHATSLNGIVWTRDPENPVLEPGPAAWEIGNVGPGYVSFEDDTFHMWYDGVSGSNIWRIGYAWTTDPYGKNWIKYSNNPVLNVGASTSWDFPRVQCGSVTKYLDTLYMFYYGGDFFTQEIGFARSTDRVNWFKHPFPCLYKGSVGSWEDYYVSNPFVLHDGIEYKMWYWGGNGEYDAKTGLATVSTLMIIPVELTSFTATSQLGKVILNWTTATEINNLGFEIERASFTTTPGQEKLWRTIGFVEGHGTTSEPQQYSYIDDISEINAPSFVYRLKQMDFLGTYEYSDEVMVENPAPVDYVLYQNYPNPFNPTTTITFGIPIKTHVVLKVFNAVGEEVAQLYNGEKEAGRYTFEFNAEGLPSGIYFYQLKADGYGETKKMLLLK